MKDYVVRIQVIKVFKLSVPATSEAEALNIADGWDSLYIQEHGTLEDMVVDYAEVE